MIISINSKIGENAYAVKELKLFLSKYTNAQILTDVSDAQKCVTIEIDSSLPEHHYVLAGDGSTLAIKGGNESSVLCGVYEALADSGILFEATGYSVPKQFSLDTFFSINKTVRPKFRLRGIRQHINFPMDVSSYTLAEAKEYFRALARMRYNAITFHSYPCQWHERKNGAPDDYAGHFFYGHTCYVPEDDALSASRVQNRKYHCIPEVEAIFEDQVKKGEFAKLWLREVMQTVKELGMELTLSVEIVSDDEDTNIAMVRNVCRTYPMIDTLELITEENGGEARGHINSADELKDAMVEYFGDEILDSDGNLPGFTGELPPHFSNSAHTLNRVINMVKCKDKWISELSENQKLRIGIYETGAEALNILRPIVRKYLPEGATMSLLPAHGAVTVANNIAITGTTEDDWQNTMFYSWAEFDGNMYMQQMSTDGLEQLVNMPDAESAYGFAINHWRTSENNMAISYAAEAAISQMSVADFYKLYASRVGIEAPEAFATACDKLAKLDTYNRDELFNIGFCAVWCWLDWCRCGKIYKPRCYSPESQQFSLNSYSEIIDDFNALLPYATKKEGIEFLRLMINRCTTSVLHLKFMMTLDTLTSIYDYNNPKPVSAEDQAKIDEILRTAKSYAVGYMHLYGEMLPDRGCEGHIVSYGGTILVYYDAIAATFGDSEFVMREDKFDAPPPPSEEVK